MPALSLAPRQVAYQVQVAHTREELLARGGGLGQLSVASSDSTAVEYVGPPLKPASLHYWRVRTWMTPGRVSNWSAPQAVATAAGDMWVAEPIWAPDGIVSLRDGTFEMSVTDHRRHREPVVPGAEHGQQLFLAASCRVADASPGTP